MSGLAPQLEERTFSALVKRRLRRALDKNAPASATPAPAQIGVGLIGVGNVARWQYLPRLREPQSPFRLRAVFDVNRGAAADVADQFSATACHSLTEMLARDDVQAVFICTPTRLHCEAALAALAARKHVLCEKPLGHTEAEARSMWAASRKAETVNMVNFSYRFRPDFTYIGRIIREGILGRVYHLQGTISQGQWFDEQGLPSKERGDAAAWKFGVEGGVVRDLGPHLVDLARSWLGEVKQVQAWTRAISSVGNAGEASCGISLAFPNGAMAQLLTSRLQTGAKERTQLEVCGSHGSIRVNQGEVSLWTRDQPRWRNLLLPAHVPDLLTTFHASINDRTTPRPTFWDGLKNNEALEAIFVSARRGVAVSLPLDSESAKLDTPLISPA